MVMGELPKGWTEINIEKLFEFKYGKGLPEHSRNKSGLIKVYGSNGVVGKHNTSITAGPTIIIGRKGSVGEVNYSDEKCWPIDTTYYIDFFPVEMPIKYWALYLKSLQLGQHEKSSAIPGVSRKDIYKVNVPLPPFNEQRRIIAKLEKILHRVDTCNERLDKIPIILKRFRQSVLDAATTGRLTADWRCNNVNAVSPKREIESLLNLTKKQRPDVLKTEPTAGHEVLIEAVPEVWATPSLYELFRFIDYRGKTPKKSSSGKRLISAKNIKMGFISNEPVEYVSDKFYRAWMTRGFPQKGDIFFITEGHTMGFAALNNRDDEFALSQRTITLQPWRPMDTRCFLFFIMSSLFQNLVRLNATGSAAIGIKAAKFRGLPIPFTSLPEQKEIVRRVEALFKKADAIEARYKKAKAFVDKLTQSILAKAFRGELVAQDPNDEPASVLLERIRVEKQKSQKKIVSIKDRMKKKYKPFIPSDLPMVAEEKAVYGKRQGKKKRSRP